MPVETPSVFAHVIQEHLELKRKNSELEGNMPLERYESKDPFENHPLFKTEEQARIEETMDGEESVPAEVIKMRGQVGTRAVGLLLGFEATLNPFLMSPAWAELKGLAPTERAGHDANVARRR